MTKNGVDWRKYAMFTLLRKELMTLGLLKSSESMLDRPMNDTRDPAEGSLDITELGRMLLDYVGIQPIEAEEADE